MALSPKPSCSHHCLAILSFGKLQRQHDTATLLSNCPLFSLTCLGFVFPLVWFFETGSHIAPAGLKTHYVVKNDFDPPASTS